MKALTFSDFPRQQEKGSDGAFYVTFILMVKRSDQYPTAY